jgi:hypothetical protein
MRKIGIKSNIINALYNIFVCGLSERITTIITFVRKFRAGFRGINGRIYLWLMA